MPIEDADRWNLRYQSDHRNAFDLPNSLLIEKSVLLPKSGLALDLAMGLGENSNFLLNHGLKVIGVDISTIAVAKAASQLPGLMAVIADLENFYIPTNHFDIIINLLYLQRDLWLPMVLGLKSDGLLFIECLTVEMLSVRPELKRDYLLSKGELQQSFSTGKIGENLEIIFYREGWFQSVTSHPRAVASLVGRKSSK